jgi:hypothetical protein
VPQSETAKEDSSFSEEKEAKRLLFLRTRIDARQCLDRGSGGEIKVFCFFSSEKKCFFQFGAVETPPTPHKRAGEAAHRLFFSRKNAFFFVVSTREQMFANARQIEVALNMKGRPAMAQENCFEVCAPAGACVLPTPCQSGAH